MTISHPIRSAASPSPAQALLTAAVLAALAVPAAAQLQFEELPRKAFAGGGGAWPESVALGDVDGDGDLDMVIGNNGQNRLYLNRARSRTTMEAVLGRMGAVGCELCSCHHDDGD